MRTCLCHGAGPGPRSAQPRKQTLPEGWEHRLGRASESRVRVRAGPGRPGRLHCTAGVSTRGASGCEGRHTHTRARARIHTAGKAVASGCDGRAPAAERPRRNRGGRADPWSRLQGVCRGEHRMMLRIRWPGNHGIDSGGTVTASTSSSASSLPAAAWCAVSKGRRQLGRNRPC